MDSLSAMVRVLDEPMGLICEGMGMGFICDVGDDGVVKYAGGSGL